MEKFVTFRNNKKENLAGVLHIPVGAKKMPAVIICHGFNGTKTQKKFVELGRALAKNGIVIFRFDFSGCGDSEGDFRKTTIQREMDDLASAYRYLSAQRFIDNNRIGILGHSRGCVVATLFINRIGSDKIKTLVLLAPSFRQKDLIRIWNNSAAIKKWRKQGYLDTHSFRVGTDYLNEIENRDYTDEIEKINLPILICHGTKDDVVPLAHSRQLFKKLKRQKRLEILKKADHDFESFDAKKKITQISLIWFGRYL